MTWNQTLHRPLLRPVLMGLLLLSTAGLARAGQQSPDLEQQVRTLLTRAESGPIYTVWERALDIVDLEGSDDALAAAVRTAGTAASPRGKLAAARALRLIAGGDLYGKEILAFVSPLLEDQDPATEAIRIAAISVLGDRDAFNTRVVPDAQKLLVAQAQSELVAPKVRIAASEALWDVGSSRQRGIAKDTLTQFLRSGDRDLRIAGALALAGINTDSGGPAWRVLREIQDEPSPDGRQARLYLELERRSREFEAILAKVMAGPGPAAGTGGDASRFSVLDELMRRVRAQHIRGSNFEDEDLLDAAAKGLMRSLDPHSAYFTSDEFAEFRFDLNRNYAGIGAFVNFDRDGDFSVVRPIYSGPAYDAGLLSGDKILEVDGWETAGHTDQEIIRRLKGPPNTKVVVTFFRTGMQEPKEVEIERRAIKVPSVNWTMLPGDVGYVELITFAADTARELDAALDDLEARGARGLVLDVRNNTGGYLQAARDVVERFVDGRKVVVSTRGRAVKETTYSTRGSARFERPMVILTNGFSASASEITAGALQDHGRAIVVGERSYGKGSVQSLLPVAAKPGEPYDDANGNRTWDQGEAYEDLNGNGKWDIGAMIKLTVARYYLPSGRSVHREFDKDGRVVDPNWGVTPDVALELREVKPEEAWKNAEVFRLLQENHFRDYVKKHLEEHRSLFLELADSDGGKTDRYPEFAQFYESLQTQLSEDDVRRWIRYTVRDMVADLKGKVYPGTRARGDVQEDAQLQEAIRQILNELDEDIRKMPEYREVLKIGFDEQAKPEVGKSGK